MRLLLLFLTILSFAHALRGRETPHRELKQDKMEDDVMMIPSVVPSTMPSTMPSSFPSMMPSMDPSSLVPEPPGPSCGLAGDACGSVGLADCCDALQCRRRSPDSDLECRGASLGKSAFKVAAGGGAAGEAFRSGTGGTNIGRRSPGSKLTLP